jgi:hypothetical protein
VTLPNAWFQIPMRRTPPVLALLVIMSQISGVV